MNDTPETDAAIKNQSKWMRPFVSTTFDGITYDSPVASLCRKLERERDEAREIAYDLAVIASHCLGSHSFSLGETSERIADTLKRWRSTQPCKK